MPGPAFLDVSDVLLDPQFAEHLTVQRRTVTIGTNGRQSLTTTTYNPVGVVTSAADDKMDREPYAQFRANKIRVHTQFRLSGPAPGQQADVVVWNGDPYVVIQLDNFSHFGGGFISALCESMSGTDQAPAI